MGGRAQVIARDYHVDTPTHRPLVVILSSSSSYRSRNTTPSAVCPPHRMSLGVARRRRVVVTSSRPPRSTCSPRCRCGAQANPVFCRSTRASGHPMPAQSGMGRATTAPTLLATYIGLPCTVSRATAPGYVRAHLVCERRAFCRDRLVGWVGSCLLHGRTGRTARSHPRRGIPDVEGWALLAPTGEAPIA